MGKLTTGTATLTLLLMLGMTYVSPGRAQTPPSAGPAATFRQFAAAVNGGDVAGALAFFADDATWVRGGTCPPGACAGTEAIRSQIEKDVSDGHDISIIDAQVSGSTLTARVELRTDATRAAGTDRIIQVFTLQFSGDKISALQARPDLTDPATAAFAARLLPTTGNPPTGDATPASVMPLALGLLLAGALLSGAGLGIRATTRRR